MIKLFLYLFVTLQLCIEPLSVKTEKLCQIAPESPLNKVVEYPAIELVLQNDLKVYLKKTEYEKGHYVFQLFAMGGYAAFPVEDRSVAILAPDIAWESGLGHQTADQLSIALYQQSIEIETKIQPFDRQIEVYAPTAKLIEGLQLVHRLFREPKFTLEGLKKATAKHQENLMVKSQQINAQQIFLNINTQNWDLYQPLDLNELKNIQLEHAQAIFKQCFSNPKDFVLVMVGDFELDDTIPLLEHYLGSIPIQEVKTLVNPNPPEFPEGITKKTFFGFSRYKKPLTHLTFPIPTHMTEEKTEIIDLICRLTKNRLLKTFRQVYDSKKKLEVNYEFPFFPQLDKSWLTIEFSSLSHETPEITQLILTTLQELKEEGPSQEEIEELREQLNERTTDLEENTYLLSVLANYHRADWNLHNVHSKKKDSILLEKEFIKNALNMYLKIDQYSMISLYP
jgi:zinc protease